MEYTSTLLKTEELDNLNIKTTQVRCGKCENNCLLTINKFNDSKSFISGIAVKKEAVELLKTKSTKHV